MDLVIPRGGEALIRRVTEKATVPVIKHYKGVCHLYVDETADLAMAAEVVTNSKVQRPGTCNALEKLLVHSAVARGVPSHGAGEDAERGAARGRAGARHPSRHAAATEEDWYAEYLDLILTVKVVDGLEEAAAHIEKYGSSHTDGILSTRRRRHRAVRGHGGFRRGHGERLHPSERRRHLRPGRGDRHQHGQAARPRPHGPEGAHHVQVGAARQRRHPDVEGLADRGDMSKARIMVVEDEGVVALQIRESLESLGYAVPLVALTGEEAVEKLLETEPDLILMDIKLTGGLSGIEAAQKIRGIASTCPSSTSPPSPTRRPSNRPRLTEPYGYVLKPFDEKSLHAIIEMSLPKHRRAREARESGWWMSAVAESMTEAVLICDAQGVREVHQPVRRGAPRQETARRPGDAHARDRVPRGRGDALAPALPRDGAAPGGQEHDARQLPPRGRGGAGVPRGVHRVTAAQPRRDPVRNSVRLSKDRGEGADPGARPAGAGRAGASAETLPSSGDTVIRGLSFEWLFLPASFGGGDAVGYLRLDDDHAAFYALDVLGEGAALRAVLPAPADVPHPAFRQGRHPRGEDLRGAAAGGS